MKLYQATLSGYSQKVKIAFNEKQVSYEAEEVNLMDPEAKAAYRKIYPMGKVPCLFLEDGHMIPESNIIIEYLDTHFEPKGSLIPADPDLARQTRVKDRMHDLYLIQSVGTIFFQGMRPEEQQDTQAIEDAQYRLGVILNFMEQNFQDKAWAMGDEFTLADCSAAPGLYYYQNMKPLNDYKNVQAYFNRLMERPSVKAIYDEVTPLFQEWKEKLAS